MLPFFRFGNPTTCCYCGDPAVGVDHVFCVASQTISRRSSDKRCYGPITFACYDCNSHIGSRAFDTFWERCEFASFRIKTKIKPILWSNQELHGLDYSLKKFVERSIAKRRWIQSRADWFETREFMLNIEDMGWELRQGGPVGRDAHNVRSYFSSTLAQVHRLYR